MGPNLNAAVRELRRALDLSQQAFATRLGLSIRAIVNYEKDRVPTPRALAQLEKLASDNDQPELARLFHDALGNQLGFGMSDRPPLSGEEIYFDRAFKSCFFENPDSTAALKIRKILEPHVVKLKREDQYSSRILDKRRKAQ